MSQSNVIAGALALAFLLYITVKGELPKYLNLFKYKPHQNATSGDSGSAGVLSQGLTFLKNNGLDVNGSGGFGSLMSGLAPGLTGLGDAVSVLEQF